MTPPIELREQAGQGDEIPDPEAGPPGREDEEGIRTLDVGPARWHRAHALLAGLPEEHPVLTPRVGEPDEVELLTEQRVERVGHMESLRIAPTRSSRRRTPRVIVEPVFGQMKEAMGFRRFSLRGKAKVTAEWHLVCAVHGLAKLFRSGWAGRVIPGWTDRPPLLRVLGWA